MQIHLHNVKLLVLILLISAQKWCTQTDSVLISELNRQKDGLYIYHNDFRINNAIEKPNIVSEINKEQLDFYTKLTNNDVIKYTLGNQTYTISSKNVWGYMQNKTLFLNYKGVFYRVPVFGAICYFAGIVEVTGYYNGVYDPMFGASGGRAMNTKEIHEFIMNYYDGTVLNFYMDELEELLKKDAEIYTAFKKLNRRNRKKQASRYIRMYNEKHPVYYLKN